jgi:hypothetical protein
METQSSNHTQQKPISIFCNGELVDTMYITGHKLGDLILEYGDNRRIMEDLNGNWWIDVEEYWTLKPDKVRI